MARPVKQPGPILPIEAYARIEFERADRVEQVDDHTVRLRVKREPKRLIAIGQPLPDDALESELADYVLLHVNCLPWARLWKNHDRLIVTPDGRQVRVPGLAKGSADLIGVVKDRHMGMGIFTAIELKQPGTHKKPRADQEEWLRFVDVLGGVTGWTRDLRGAVALVAKARGESVEWVVENIERYSGKAVLL